MKRVCINLDLETVERLDKLSEENFTIKSKLIRKAVNEFLDKNFGGVR